MSAEGTAGGGGRRGVPPWAVRRFVVDPLFVPVAVVGVCVGLVVAVVGLLGVPLDRRLRVSRAAMLAAVYLGTEAVVIVAAFELWLARPVLGRQKRRQKQRQRQPYENAHVWVLRCALGVLIVAARRLTGLRLDISEPPVGGPGADGGTPPVLVLSRHAGPGDSFVLVHLLLSRYRLVPRVVLLGRLQLDPAIDILLGRLDACFVRNDGGDEQAAERIGALARRLGPGEALVIFPEGANFTPSRRRRLIARLRARGQWERAAVAEDLDAVLPPRPAGVLAALAAGTIAAAMIVAHAGLDELDEPGEVWRAVPFTVPLTMRWWWAPVSEIPPGDAGRRQWLTMHWAVLNAWIDARRAEADAEPAGIRSGGPS
jgi:1-acyl-sn-glycerol-3-phosphate acyltransferase